MSKITVNAVLTVLRLVVSLTSKVVRLIYSIADLVDDGCINASITRPDWMVSLTTVCSNMESLLGHLRCVESEVSNEV